MPWSTQKPFAHANQRICRLLTFRDFCIQVRVPGCKFETLQRGGLYNQLSALSLRAVNVRERSSGGTRCDEFDQILEAVIEPVDFKPGAIVPQPLLNPKIEAARAFRAQIGIAQKERRG